MTSLGKNESPSRKGSEQMAQQTFFLRIAGWGRLPRKFFQTVADLRHCVLRVVRAPDIPRIRGADLPAVLQPGNGGMRNGIVLVTGPTRFREIFNFSRPSLDKTDR